MRGVHLGVRDILPTPAEIRAAALRIAPHIVATPFRRSEGLSEFLGGEVWLKLECEQATGSFKIRGATNALLLLSAAERARGVVTASAGNHGLGIASAAKALGINATVFVPRGAPAVKRDRIAQLGATIDATAHGYDAAEIAARAFALKSGATFVSPCSGRAVLAGQGTIALEMLGELPSLETVILSVGGGGLAGGVGGLLRVEASTAQIVGAQSERTNAMALALASGRPTDIPDLPTLADGLAGLVDAEMLAQGQAALDEVAVVTEEDIENAIAYLWIEEGHKVEGAGAAGVAALLSGKVRTLRFPVAVVVSGGNIDAAKIEEILDGAHER